MDSLALTMEKGKMAKIVYLVLLVFGLAVVRCEQAIAQHIEPVHYFSHNGTPNTFIKEEDGQLYQYEYDENFQLKSISPYNYVVDTVWYYSDIIFGLHRCHQSIESAFILNYDGLFRRFDGAGNIVEIGNYVKGAKTGSWYTFNEHGDTLSSLYYKRELEGWTELYGLAWKKHPNLVVEWIGSFEDGRTGAWEWFYDNGNPKIRVQYENNLPFGLYQEYHPNGNLALVGELEIVHFESGVIWSREKEDSIRQVEMMKRNGNYNGLSGEYYDFRSIKTGQWLLYTIDGSDSTVIDYSTMIADSCLFGTTPIIDYPYSFLKRNYDVCKIHYDP